MTYSDLVYSTAFHVKTKPTLANTSGKPLIGTNPSSHHLTKKKTVRFPANSYIGRNFKQRFQSFCQILRGQAQIQITNCPGENLSTGLVKNKLIHIVAQ